MSSVIEGYNYDIFISYRQKDNRHDGWVTEFVDQLKGELESTFKEEISVYFDINPHDGLLETHDVDASLKDKMKCLVFIPVISRTYCDPKSFAWEHEFKAFVEQASVDQFGLKVKLPNGNVAGRVLPVRIHDLDDEDIKLCESVLDSVLRGIEFIYKEPGVNRSLSITDHEEKNLNKTSYRNQINKVALAIKEIITAIGHDNSQNKDVKKESFKPESIRGKSSIKPIVYGSILFLALLIPGLIFFPKFLGKKDQPEKSIAVLPFVNDSPSDSTTYFINGVMEEILNNLQKIKEFRVLSRTSTEHYRGTAIPPVHELARKLHVNYIVEGSGQKYGNFYRLRVQLIDTKSDKHLWAESYEKEILGTKDIYGTQSQIAQSIARELKATITPEEKQLIEKTPTTNLTAYYYYQKAQEEFARYPYPEFNQEADKKAAMLFREAIKLDSKFALAYVGLANVYWARWDRDYTISGNNILRNQFLDSVLVLSEIALSCDNQLSEAYYVRGGYYDLKGEPERAMEEWDKTIRYNPNYWNAYRLRGNRYDGYDLVKALENMHKAVSLNNGPELPQCLNNLGFEYYSAGFPDKGNYYLKESLKLENDSVRYLYNSGLMIQSLGDYNRAAVILKKSYVKDSTNTDILRALSFNYLFNGKSGEALKYFEKYLSILKSRGQQPGLVDYPHIGCAYRLTGNVKEAEYFFDKGIADYNDLISSSLYVDSYQIACLYACKNDRKNAYACLKKFSQTQYCRSYGGTFLKDDPSFDSIKSEPEFQKIVKDIEMKYQAEHERVRKWLIQNEKL